MLAKCHALVLLKNGPRWWLFPCTYQLVTFTFCIADIPVCPFFQSSSLFFKKLNINYQGFCARKMLCSHVSESWLSTRPVHEAKTAHFNQTLVLSRNISADFSDARATWSSSQFFWSSFKRTFSFRTYFDIIVKLINSCWFKAENVTEFLFSPDC